MAFKLTYATMFDPPEELHERFEAAVANCRANMGNTYGHHIRGRVAR